MNRPGKYTLRLCLPGLLAICAQATSAQTLLTVTDGSGDPGKGPAMADIWADPNPPGMLFDRWSEDDHLVFRADEWHSRVKTGAKRIRISAVYRPAPEWTTGQPEAVGTTLMRFFFPPNPVGIVFHFHGTGGGRNGLFNNPEQRIFARELVAEGFAVIALDSADRVNKQWDTRLPPDNPDITNVQAAIDLFIARNLITAATPVYASGISNGGGFAPRISLSLGFSGTAIFIATSNAALMSITTVPTIWNVMENDTVLNAGSVERARGAYTTLRSRGIRAEFNLLRPSPVFPERFRRIPGLSRSDSAAIHIALKDGGFLDRRNFLKDNPQTSNWASVIPGRYSGSLSGISDQLSICYTEHKFFGDYNRRVVKFFKSIVSN